MSKGNCQKTTKRITHAYLDLDSVAYVGACIAEKLNYQYFTLDGTNESEVFKTAKDAKKWLQSGVDFGVLDPKDWVRKTIKDLRPLEIAIKGVEYELQSWIKSIKELTKNPDIKFAGYLTSSGIKDKDIGGLEDRYQFNRYDPKVLKETGEYVKVPSPTHLKECRNYLLTKYDWVKMSPSKKEADALVICFAEKRGYNAVAAFKDKDLFQIMGSHAIDMNKDKKERVLVEISQLGMVETYKTGGANPKNEARGNGFKLICYQTVRGDSSDGYKGIAGIGAVAAVKLFESAETVEECCQILVKLYSEKWPNGHTYTSWDNKEITKTWQEMLDQHMRLAYHERGTKDSETPIKRFLENLEPLYKFNKEK